MDPDAGAQQRRQLRAVVHRVRDGLAVRRRLEALDRQQVGQQVERDVVEHDRGDHLVRARLGLEDSRRGRPTARRRAVPARTATSRWSPGAGASGSRRTRRRSRTGDDLALAADVEQAGPERQAHRQAAEDQRGRVGQGLGDRAEVSGQGALGRRGRVEDRALEQRDVAVPDGLEAVAEGVPRILEEVVGRGLGLGVGDGDQDSADQHRGHEREDGHHQAAGPQPGDQQPEGCGRLSPRARVSAACGSAAGSAVCSLTEPTPPCPAPVGRGPCRPSAGRSHRGRPRRASRR